MPEDLRFDVYRDLPEELRGDAIELMREIVVLQQEWVSQSSEAAYDEWRAALERMTRLLAPFRGAEA
jgi:hypothetical protein